ncbi:MAG: hypothetical protein ABI539_01260 [Acidobacteriota bacterium]
MHLIQCAKCGEKVDQAKAFCSECGSSLVAEDERKAVSEFDASAGTVQYGKTVYNQLLSDMGLDISELKIADAPTAAKAPQPEHIEQLGPGQADQTARWFRKAWFWVAAAALALLIVIAVLAALLVMIYIFYLKR